MSFRVPSVILSDSEESDFYKRNPLPERGIFLPHYYPLPLAGGLRGVGLSQTIHRNIKAELKALLKVFLSKLVIQLKKIIQNFFKHYYLFLGKRFYKFLIKR